MNWCAICGNRCVCGHRCVRCGRYLAAILTGTGYMCAACWLMAERLRPKEKH